jgi:hypothetical protein
MASAKASPICTAFSTFLVEVTSTEPDRLFRITSNTSACITCNYFFIRKNQLEISMDKNKKQNNISP